MSDYEDRPAVIAAITFSETILQARPTSCAVPLLEGGNLGLFTCLGYKIIEKKIAMETTAGRASFSGDAKILFLEWPIALISPQQK